MTMNVKFCFGGKLGIWNSGNTVTRALTTISKCNIGLIMSKYRIPSINTKCSKCCQTAYLEAVS